MCLLSFGSHFGFCLHVLGNKTHLFQSRTPDAHLTLLCHFKSVISHLGNIVILDKPAHEQNRTQRNKMHFLPERNSENRAGFISEFLPLSCYFFMSSTDMNAVKICKFKSLCEGKQTRESKECTKKQKQAGPVAFLEKRRPIYAPRSHTSVPTLPDGMWSRNQKAEAWQKLGRRDGTTNLSAPTTRHLKEENIRQDFGLGLHTSTPLG